MHIRPNPRVARNLTGRPPLNRLRPARGHLRPSPPAPVRAGLACVAAVCLLAVGFAGHVSAVAGDVSATSPREVRVGVYDYPPLVRRAESGGVEGIFPEVLAEVGRRQGWSITYVSGSWQENLEWLASGRIDLVLGISRSAERAAVFNLSTEPVVSTWAQVYTRPDSPIATILEPRSHAHRRAARGAVPTVVQGTRSGVWDPPPLPKTATRLTTCSQPSSGAMGRQRFANGSPGSLTNGSTGLVRSPILYNPWALVFGAAKGRNQDLLDASDAYLRSARRESRVNLPSHHREVVRPRPAGTDAGLDPVGLLFDHRPAVPLRRGEPSAEATGEAQDQGAQPVDDRD